MQKKLLRCIFMPENELRPILQCMKLTFVFSVLCCLQLSANLHSQTRLTMRMKDASLTDVFLAIEKKTS